METKRIFFVGVGGQGNILATKLLGEAALAAGVPVSMSETHGMAQRGGVVESTALVGPARSSIIADGEADIILAFEPLEALRVLPKANPRTLLIASTSKLPPFTVAIGQGTYPDLDEILAYVRGKVGRLIAFDAMEEAKAAGNPLGVNMVMLGALCAAGQLPVSESFFRQAIEEGTKRAFVQANLDCFNRGLEVACQAAA